MAETKLISWKEKTVDTGIGEEAYQGMYPETVPEAISLSNTVKNNLGLTSDSLLDSALDKLSKTCQDLRSQGKTTGTADNLALSVPIFTLYDGIVIRAKLHLDVGEGANLNVNNTGAKPIVRLDGAPIDVVIKEGTWATFIYSSTLSAWVFNGGSTKSVVKTAIFTQTGLWTVPAGITSVNLFLIGGGGGAGGSQIKKVAQTSTGDEYFYSTGGGGGAGYITKSTVTVTPNAQIQVTIGQGGAGGTNRPDSSTSLATNGGNGGTTSFGSLASANGGNGGKIGTLTTSEATNTGGDGGVGSSGGAGGGSTHYVPNSGYVDTAYGNGGNGNYCGGGAGGKNSKGGNGGTYGGGGGGETTAGTGGTYGGNGATGSTYATNGTNTINMTDVEFRGEGVAGIGRYAGGGGYGGNGGDGAGTASACGSGGGYGGNGKTHGGGGGYGANAVDAGGAGYGVGNYGKGGTDTGTAQASAGSGTSGICIISWIAQEA